MGFSTEQEAFWSGDFGNEYVERNKGADLLARNVALFNRIFSRMERISSMIEYGANIGLNLSACRVLLPDLQISAVEINEKAFKQLRCIPDIQATHQSILEFRPDRQWDFVLIKGVLIHTAPEQLERVYRMLYESSSKYICLVEYYNPTPVEVVYRGHTGKLFKRDFAGEILDRYADLKLIGYGFTYHRDPIFPQDDNTWFLLEKK